MPSRTVALCAALAALAACGDARRAASQSGVGACGRCHLDAQTAAGVHATHVRALSGDAACAQCHPDPRAGSTTHANGRIDVAFGAFATRGGALASTFDRDARTCTAVYCHGAFPGGNAANAPPWRSGEGDAGCGTCHGLPPASTHAGMPADLGGCVVCHATTVHADGTLVDGGTHMSGVPDGRHTDPWMVATSAGFHGLAARQGLSACQGCHGLDLEGGSGPACATCHGEGGSLTCTSCHGTIASGAASSHVGGASPSASCRTCHETWQAAGGHYRLPTGGSFPDVACVGCHDGLGAALSERTPPLLVAWQDADGDWHGARAGTGSGGTLKAPFARGAAALPCRSCHDEHASSNAFLFASSVNGSPIPAGTVNRAGVGAEAVCSSCHEGERHAWCISCHAGITRVPGDPMRAGSPCFYCHGHEGIVNFVPPSDYQHDGSEEEGSPRCAHCHTSWAPPATEYAGPSIVSGLVNVRDVGLDAATIAWSTDEAATGSVEWGTSALDRVNGPTALGTAHSVSLTGLTPATTYSFRARSVDRFRNVSRSTILTFRTAAPDGPPQPALVDEPSFTSCGSPAVVTLEWLPVADPDGDPVEYRLVLDDSPLFDTPLVDTGWTTATSHTASFAVTTSYVSCFWRVQARDATHDVASPWSAVDHFFLNRYPTGRCP
jgi:predicted CxxxxCH...CXXCH cytochrome family protein